MNREAEVAERTWDGRSGTEDKMQGKLPSREQEAVGGSPSELRAQLHGWGQKAGA